MRLLSVMKSMKRSAAGVGETARRVHMLTARAGTSKSVRSGTITPRLRPDCENSSVTQATPSPIRASEISRLCDPSSISGRMVSPWLRK